MLRVPHGATSRPTLSRPANGYGRLPGRPGPDPSWDAEVRAGRVGYDPALLLEPEVVLDGAPSPMPEHLHPAPHPHSR